MLLSGQGGWMSRRNWQMWLLILLCISLCAWMVVSEEVELVTHLGMLLLRSYHQCKEFGQVFLIAWMEEFYENIDLNLSFMKDKRKSAGPEEHILSAESISSLSASD